MSVRLATPEDLEALLALERSVPEAPHWEGAQYRSALCEGDQGPVQRRVFVWQSGPGVSGFAIGMLWSAQGICVAEIESVVVAVDARRRGIATILCRALLAWCQSHSVTELTLEVRASSEGAIALYRKLGFGSTGRRRLYYRDPSEDAELMRFIS